MDAARLAQLVKEDSTHRHKVTLRTCIDNLTAGIIIGKSGNNIRQLKHSVPITLHVEGSKFASCGRIMYMIGYPHDLATGWGECCHMLLKSQHILALEEFTVDFILPHHFLMYIQEGTHINYLQSIASTTGIVLILKGEFLPRSTDRLLCMLLPDYSPHSLNAFKLAVFQLAELMQNNRTIILSPGNVYYDPSDTPKSHAVNETINELLEKYNNLRLKDAVYPLKKQ